MKRYNLFNYIEYLKDNPKGYWFSRRWIFLLLIRNGRSTSWFWRAGRMGGI